MKPSGFHPASRMGKGVVKVRGGQNKGTRRMRRVGRPTSSKLGFGFKSGR